MSTMHNPLHPGEIVRDALFNETGINSITEAANKLSIDRTTLSRLLNGHAGISPEMAFKLGLFLGTSTEMWMNIQRDYDLWMVEKKFEHIKSKKILAHTLRSSRGTFTHHTTHR